MRYNLGGTCSRLTAQVGVDDEVSARGTVVFQVWADGTKLYDSGVMTGSAATKAVEDKQIAQQEAERARFIVEKAEQERQASVIRAEGESEAADTIGKAVAKSGDGLIMIRRIETQKDIASMMSNNPNVTYLPSGGGGGGGGGSGGGNFLLGLRS